MIRCVPFGLAGERFLSTEAIYPWDWGGFAAVNTAIRGRSLTGRATAPYMSVLPDACGQDRSGRLAQRESTTFTR